MKRLVLTLLAALALCACESGKANTAISQDEKIDSFIKSKYADSDVVFNNGVNRIVLEAGDSTAFAAPGDRVSFSYVGRNFSGSSIGGAFTLGEYTSTLGSGEMIQGLEYGIEGMCPGEHSYIIFSCKYGYDKSVAGIGSDQPLVFEVTLNEINPHNE